MKILNTKFKKVLIISGSAILIIMLLTILFISPITKFLVEKYDQKYLGRQIKMDWAYVNPFTGYAHFSNFKIYESGSDSIFFSASSLNINFTLYKLLTKTYEISELALDHPWGIVIQNKKDLNFNDLINRFTSSATDTTLAKVRFNILHVKLTNGEFHYQEKVIPINYFIKHVNFESAGIQWNTDTVEGVFSFLPGQGSGKVNGDFTINLKNLDYRYSVLIQKLDLKFIQQYLKDLANYGSFTADLDADIKATGNFDNQENVTATGMLAINNLHLGKNPKDDYMSFDRLIIAIHELSPLKHKYLFDSLILSHLYFKYELYDHLDNLETMFGTKGANISAVREDPSRFNLIVEIARYVKVLARNFFQSYYKINRLAIEKGDLEFNDYSLNEKFATHLSPLSVFADSVDKNHNQVEIAFKSGIQPYGNVSVALSINPKDTADFDMQYSFQNLPASLFNPYLISYTSFPLDRGTIELSGKWEVRKGEIQSKNHLVIMDPRVTRRIKNKNLSWLPLPLMMSIVREYGNVIDYEIPITGNLKNPKFHLHDVLTDVLGNVFIKPTTTAYRMEVRNTETEIEKSLSLKWVTRQNAMRPEQEKFISKMAEFLEQNPQATISVSPQQYTLKEKEYILFFEAKKKYFLDTHLREAGLFSGKDSETVNKMSVKDSLFTAYMNKRVNDTLLFTIQEKCYKLIGASLINSRFKELNAERKAVFMNSFQKLDVQDRVHFQAPVSTIPFNGFSFYKIDYTGELPKSLVTAYLKIQELNDEAPRKKYEREQKEMHR